MDAQNHLGLKYISLGRGRNQNRGNFLGRFRNNAYRGIWRTIKIWEVDIGITLIAEESYVTILQVVRGIGIITTITGETIIEVKVMIGIEVDQKTGKTEVGEEIGVWAMAGLGQDQGQAQIETGSDALSVDSMIILQGNVWPNVKKERTNTANIQFRW